LVFNLSVKIEIKQENTSMRKSVRYHLIAYSALILFSVVNPARGFDLRAHEALSDRVLQSKISQLNNFLMGELGNEFPNGIEQSINGNTVRRWIVDGSLSEDFPPSRVLAHFHNPLRSWGTAGLGVVFRSAVIWAQDRVQTADGNHSWHDARHFYYQALTGKIKGERHQAWAGMFRDLGHIIHLIQDLAAPSHTRNDPHLVEDGFHSWADREDNRTFLSGMVGKPFSSSILNLDPNSLAPIPIARIMDTERYRQSGVTEAGNDIGIAEYSNANFFSDDTIFSADFPFPNESSVELGLPEPEPKTGELRRYFKKVRDGELVNHLAVPSALYETLGDALEDQEKGLDDKVFEDYAMLLMPRAIGYSAGLIDYFFRGRLNVSVIDSEPFGGSGVSSLRVNVANATSASEWPGNSETTEGDLVAVLMSGNQVFGVARPNSEGNEGKHEVTRESREFPFAFGLGKLPMDASDLSVMLVYRGPLGLEEDAVAVGRAPLSPLSVEPVSGVLSCPDGSVTFTASGGLGPYTWSTTQGTLEVEEDGRTAHLKTQTNGTVSGNAYRIIGDALRTLFPFQCRARQGRCTVMYNCEDAVVLRQESGGAGETHFMCQSPDSSSGCGIENCGESLCEFVEANQSGAFFEDLRSQQMIESGCAPCTLVVKDGVVVTVKDSGGTEVTATVTGGTPPSMAASTP